LDKEEPQFSAYGQVANKLLYFLLAYIILYVVVSIASVFFFVPGVYLSLRLQFFYALIVDEDAGLIASFKRSWAITKGQTLQLFVLLLIQIFIFFIGTIAFGIGIFIAAPLIILMYACTYKKLIAPAAQNN
jgi:uncharacterized membrane protein